MRNAALAALVAFALVCAVSQDASPQQAGAPPTTAYTTLIDNIKRVTDARHLDLDTNAIHWVFVVSVADASTSPGSAQAVRDLIREFGAREIYGDSGADDKISIVPFQLNVRQADVKRDLNATSPDVKGGELVSMIPRQAETELPEGSKAGTSPQPYQGGHDLEKALLYTVTDVVQQSPGNVVIITLGDTHASNMPTNDQRYPLTERNPAQMSRLAEAFDRAGISSTPAADFLVNYPEGQGETWPIYVRLYLPNTPAASRFKASRSQPETLVTQQPDQKKSDQHDNARRPPPPPPPGSSSALWPLLIVAILLIAAFAARGVLLPVPLRVTVDGETQDIRPGERVQLFAYGAKPEGKAIQLKTQGSQLPQNGPLAVITHAGRSAVVLSPNLCQVENAIGESGPLTIKAGRAEESVTLRADRERKLIKISVLK